MSVLAKARAKRTYKPADERREQILDCALAVFAAKGYHGASIADVCTRAKIGRATLYQYFRDKRDVLLALADRIATRITDAVATRRPMRIPPGAEVTEAQAVQFVEGRFMEILNVVFEDERTTRLILRAGRGAGDGVVDEILDRIEGAVLGLVEADLIEAQRAGLVRPLDARLVARFFLGGLEKVVLSYVDDDLPLDVGAISHEAALLQMGGIFQRSPPTPASLVPKSDKENPR